jgi:2-oxoglutarate dehydrogenase complex dehydrogenase (E1) component-like enzyme
MLVNLTTAEPVIRLCDVMVNTNDKNVCGASHVMKSLHGVAEYSKDKPLTKAVLQWARSQDFEIASSLKEGYPTEWVIGRCSGYAAEMGLPLTGANLAIRSDGFVFQDMAEAYELHGIQSDERHISHIANKSTPDVLSMSGIIAFSLVYADLNPENLDCFNARELLILAAAEITEAKLEVNPELAVNVLTRLVDLLPANTDISGLEATVLAPFLQKIRKYNGFRLEDALGL